MPRSNRIRKYIIELAESPIAEKISFIPPFPILVIEIILLYHAFILNEPFIIVMTTILLILSIVEIFLVFREIHEKYSRSNFDRELTIRLDDFIVEKNEKNVRKIVENFIEVHPNFEENRNEIYHIACKIMETHKKELWEKTLELRLKKFILKNSKNSIRDIIDNFIEKYPEYKKYPGRIYPQAAQMIDKYSKNQ